MVNRTNQHAAYKVVWAGDGDDVAKGDIVVIKTDGDRPFTIGKVLTDPVGTSQHADVLYYTN